jgi:hypothetical protein
VLIREGHDFQATEKALRDVLELDPHNQEAQHNIDVLLREHRAPAGRPRLVAASA